MRRTSETGGRSASAEDANSPRTFLVLEEPSPKPRRPLTFRCRPEAHSKRSPSPFDVLLAPAQGLTTCVPGEVGPPSRRDLRRRAGEGKAGRYPRTPSVVFRAYEPRPASRARSKLECELRARAPFRLLPVHAPRQAALWTSSGLVTSRTLWPCDLGATKTRDTSNRLLPPNRTACTRTS